VEQHRRNLFSTSVANIPPQSMIAISIEYQTEVDMDNYIFSYAMPMAVTPRYDNTHPETLLKVVSAAGQPWAQDVINRLKLSNFKGGENPVHLDVSLNAGFDIGKIESPSHKISTSKKDGETHIKLKDSIIKGEKDFILNWQPAKTDDLQVTRYSEEYEGSWYSQVMIMPPRDIADVEVAAKARHVSFIIDTSGSMGGPSIQQAREALIKAVNALEPKDRFSIIEFNSDYRKLFDEPLQATADNRAAAVREISKLQANGGTEFNGAMVEAFNEPEMEGYMRQIVFITDGAISYEDEVISLIDSHARTSAGKSPARLFTVGIGSAPNSYLMNAMAEAGRGSATFISDTRMVEQKMGDLFEKMTRPALTNVTLNLPDNIGVEILPSVMPDLLASEPARILVKSEKPLGRIEIQGDKAGAPWQEILPAAELKPAKGLHKLYARRKIAEIESPVYRGDYQTRETQVAELGVKYQVVSSNTSLVAVDEEILRPHYEPLYTKQYDPTLPLGWKEGRMEARAAALAYDKLLEEKAKNKTDSEDQEKLSLPETASGYLMGLVGGLIMMLLSIVGFFGGRSFARKS
jgi:Ca-activated chloride channel family protein